MTVVRVAILDDHPIVRAGLRAALEPVVGIEVVGDASTVEQILHVVDAESPDVVLVDLHLGGDQSGHDAIAAIVERSPESRMVVVTAFDNERDVRSALSAGATGYVLKDAPESELIAAVFGAAQGQRPLSPLVANRLAFSTTADPQALTERELEVLQAVAEGKDNTSIARALFISQATVKSHLSHAFTKLDVSTRTGAVAEARRRGLIR